MSDWKDEFDKLFVIKKRLDCGKITHYQYELIDQLNLVKKLKDFIESLLSKQLEQHAMKMAGILAQADQKLTIYRADLLEKVEGLKKKDNLHPELDEFGKNCECYDCSSRDGFNYALDQVLSLLKGELV